MTESCHNGHWDYFLGGEVQDQRMWPGGPQQETEALASDWCSWTVSFQFSRLPGQDGEDDKL